MILVACLIVLLTLVQALFGVGILVFGTPLLLLLGFPFEKVLLWLLPCSLVVSLLQTREYSPAPGLRRLFVMWVVPGVLAGTALLLWCEPRLYLRGLVGCLLVLTAMLRGMSGLQSVLRRFALRFSPLYLAIMGIVHGLTNLGGGLLVMYVGVLNTDKQRIRAGVAAGYLLMVVCQLTVLLPVCYQLLEYWHVFLPLLAGLAYAGPGRMLFRLTGTVMFGRLFTGMMLAMGVVLLLT